MNGDEYTNLIGMQQLKSKGESLKNDELKQDSPPSMKLLILCEWCVLPLFDTLLDYYQNVQEELSDIEKKQQKIDSEAAILEKRLRKVMAMGNNQYGLSMCIIIIAILPTRWQREA